MRATITFAILCFASSASADMIPSPQCPPGWEPRRVGHSARCFPTECASDSQCTGEARCREVRRCYASQPVPQGRVRQDPPPRAWVPRPDALCQTEAQCNEGERCRPTRECAPPPRAPVPGAVTAAGCSATPGSSALLALIFLAAAVLALRARLSPCRSSGGGKGVGDPRR